MESIWSKSTTFKKRSRLQEGRAVEAAVIGGGMAGILTAFYLQQKGVETIVLEANTIGSGQTAGTTAKITSQHGAVCQRLLNNLGEKSALLYVRAHQQAIREYRSLIRQLHIDCHFTECPSYLYSMQPAHMSGSSPAGPLLLQAEAKAAGYLGLPVTYLSGASGSGLPFPATGALRLTGQAMFHPLEFLKAVADSLTIYEHTPALSIRGDTIQTPAGDVRAKYIVMATHYPFLNKPGYYFLRMHQTRSYVAALGQAPELNGMYYSVDPGGLSLRNSGPLLLAGAGVHRTGRNPGGQYEQLAAKTQAQFSGSFVTAHWSAQDCITPDSMPYIGRFSRRTPRLYVATGFGKWGMTSSMVSARLISDLITGKENPYTALFSPSRHTLRASARSVLHDGMEAAENLSRQLFYIPGRKAQDLPCGKGGIVNYYGKKMGAYRDEKGHLYLVSSRCPHLGCQLSWNPDEKTWDCPCHGSRFDYTGKLLNNPAQISLPAFQPDKDRAYQTER